MRSRFATSAVAVHVFFGLLILTSSPSVDDVQNKQWFLTYLDTSRAHTISTGSGIVVAVIDTGVNAKHPDLVGSVLPGAITYLGPGRVENAQVDAKGHGTRMAGNIAAHGHGAHEGAFGIAPGAKILPIVDTADDGSSGSNLADNMAAGISFAVRSGAKVISISQNAVTSTPALVEAVADAESSDVVLVAAAGNRDGGELAVGIPARFPGVVAVGSVDERGEHYPGSTTGPQVLISAPGVDIYQTGPGDGYSSGTGTSDATSITAGAVALVRAKYPNLSAAEVIHRLTATAIDKGPPGRDNEYGYGVINIVAALTADVPPLSASPSPATSAVGQIPSRSSADAQPGGGRSSLLIVIPVVAILCALIVILVWRATRRRTPG